MIRLWDINENFIVYRGVVVFMIFKDSYGKYEIAFLLAAFVAMLGLFFYLDNTLVPVYDMYNIIDDYIPFVPVFIVPYLIWFPFFICPCVYFLIKSKKDFVKALRYIVLGYAICNLIYFFYPNGQSLRPVYYSDDMFSQIIKYLQAADTPINVFPSLHVYVSLAVNTVVWQYNGFKLNYIIKISFLITAILICLSTVFIKQHSVVDIIGGVVLWALVRYMLFENKIWYSINNK